MFPYSVAALNISNPFTTKVFLIHLPSQVLVHHLHLVLQLTLVCPQQLEQRHQHDSAHAISYVEVHYMACCYPT